MKVPEPTINRVVTDGLAILGDSSCHTRTSSLPSLGIDLSSSHSTREAFQRFYSQRLDDAQFDAAKIFFHSQRISEWLAGRIPAPVTLELDITLSCNDRCPRCVHRFALSERHLSLARISSILSDAAEIGVQGLTLTGGGDPLRHPEFLSVLKLVRERRFAAGMFTNAGLIDSDSLAREMVKTFSWIRVSLDSGSESSFRRSRGRKGYHQRLECLRRLAVARREVQSKCELGASFLTSASVAEDVVPATLTVKQLGFDYIQFKPMIHWSRNAHHLSNSMDQTGVFEAIGKEALSFEDESFRVLVSTKKYQPEILEEDRSFSAFHCAWFILPVGLSVRSQSGRAALYLDCSAKYIDRWTVMEFDSFREAVYSEDRVQAIKSSSSKVYCTPAEKHAAYNYQLERLLTLHHLQPLDSSRVRALAPPTVKHPFSL